MDRRPRGRPRRGPRTNHPRRPTPGCRSRTRGKSSVTRSSTAAWRLRRTGSRSTSCSAAASAVALAGGPQSFADPVGVAEQERPTERPGGRPVSRQAFGGGQGVSHLEQQDVNNSSTAATSADADQVGDARVEYQTTRTSLASATPASSCILARTYGSWTCTRGGCPPDVRRPTTVGPRGVPRRSRAGSSAPGPWPSATRPRPGTRSIRPSRAGRGSGAVRGRRRGAGVRARECAVPSATAAAGGRRSVGRCAARRRAGGRSATPQQVLAARPGARRSPRRSPARERPARTAARSGIGRPGRASLRRACSAIRATTSGTLPVVASRRATCTTSAGCQPRSTSPRAR